MEGGSLNNNKKKSGKIWDWVAASPTSGSDRVTKRDQISALLYRCQVCACLKFKTSSLFKLNLCSLCISIILGLYRKSKRD